MFFLSLLIISIANISLLLSGIKRSFLILQIVLKEEPVLFKRLRKFSKLVFTPLMLT